MESKDPSDKHFKVSMIKSGFRLVAACTLTFTDNNLIVFAGILLFLAEILGVVEEL